MEITFMRKGLWDTIAMNSKPLNMAYIEENNLMAEPESPNEIEQGWQEGFHTTREGVEMRLEEMTEEHLKNTIRYFEGKLDVSPLEAELESRNKSI
jgi:hypothetical protein